MLRAVLFSLLFYNSACQNAALKEIEYHIFSRGYEVVIKINKDSTYLTINNQTEISKTSWEKWSDLIEILNEINLTELESIAPPTENYANDASHGALLIIITKNKIFESKTFDHENPPTEFHHLINVILEGSEL